MFFVNDVDEYLWVAPATGRNGKLGRWQGRDLRMANDSEYLEQQTPCMAWNSFHFSLTVQVVVTNVLLRTSSM